MDRKDWGIKRVCLGCNARFYDFNKFPIICPACGMEHDAEYLSKRKSKPISEKNSENEIVDNDVISSVTEDDIASLDDGNEDEVIPLDEIPEE